MNDVETYRVELAGKWTLADFHEFPYAYTQSYSFLYSLMADEIPEDALEDSPYRIYPWRGGYSAVNFFKRLYSDIPRSERPQVISISYASPGWIELGLVLVVAMSLRKIIDNLCKAAKSINQTYNEIYMGMQERKLLSLDSKSAELKLDKEHLEFLERSSDTFAKLLGFESYGTLIRYSPNPLTTLKMLMAFYRRVRKLKDYQIKDKLKF
jgi:hypothetical protein